MCSDWARASFTDAGVPWQLAERCPRFVAPLVMGVVLVCLVLAFWRLRVDPRRRALFLLLAGYATGGALLLILSRSRYEWVTTSMSATPCSTPGHSALAFVMAVPVLIPTRRRSNSCDGSGVVFLGMMGCMSVYRRVVRGDCPGRVVAEARRVTLKSCKQHRGRERSIWRRITRCCFRIGSGAHVRNVEIGGDDAESWRVLSRVKQEAAGRPVRFLLVCDEYTEGHSACGGAPIDGVAAPILSLRAGAVAARPGL
jgi:hypothetical protein